jgi:hypothetical protein
MCDYIIIWIHHTNNKDTILHQTKSHTPTLFIYEVVALLRYSLRIVCIYILSEDNIVHQVLQRISEQFQ